VSNALILHGKPFLYTGGSGAYMHGRRIKGQGRAVSPGFSCMILIKQREA